MPNYVLNRDYTHRSLYGHSIGFEKNQPVWVPPGPIEVEVVRIGAEKVDGDNPDVIDAEKPVKVALGYDELEALVREAFVEIIKTNNSKDFTGAGVPTVKAVEKATGEDVDSKFVAEVWAKFKEEGGL